VAGAEILGLSPRRPGGVFAGRTTNTPALQAAADALDEGDPVVAYSLAYPSAVLAMLLVIGLLLGTAAVAATARAAAARRAPRSS
jgi:putative transport protein